MAKTYSLVTLLALVCLIAACTGLEPHAHANTNTYVGTCPVPCLHTDPYTNFYSYSHDSTCHYTYPHADRDARTRPNHFRQSGHRQHPDSERYCPFHRREWLRLSY